MREHGTTSAYYIIRVMAAMFVVVYLLLLIVNVMTTSRVKRFIYDSHACISIAYNPDLIYLPYFCKRGSASILYFLFSFLFRRLSSLSLLEVGLVGSRPPMEWRPVLSFTSLYIPHVPLPYLGSLSWYLTTVYTYLLDTFLAIAYVRYVCTYCVLHGSKLDIFTYLGTYLSI